MSLSLPSDTKFMCVAEKETSLTFTCLLWCGVVRLPSIMTLWQIRTLKPGLVPHVKVPTVYQQNNFHKNTERWFSYFVNQ